MAAQPGPNIVAAWRWCAGGLRQRPQVQVLCAVRRDDSLGNPVLVRGAPRRASAVATRVRQDDVMPVAADFRLYHSNALDVLAGLLAAAVATVPDDGDWMRPDVVLVPQASMRRWVQQALAERLGICQPAAADAGRIRRPRAGRKPGAGAGR